MQRYKNWTFGKPDYWLLICTLSSRNNEKSKTVFMGTKFYKTMIFSAVLGLVAKNCPYEVPGLPQSSCVSQPEKLAPPVCSQALSGWLKLWAKTSKDCFGLWGVKLAIIKNMKNEYFHTTDFAVDQRSCCSGENHFFLQIQWQRNPLYFSHYFCKNLLVWLLLTHFILAGLITVITCLGLPRSFLLAIQSFGGEAVLMFPFVRPSLSKPLLSLFVVVVCCFEAT